MTRSSNRPIGAVRHRSMAATVACLAAWLLAACATVPKPEELLSFEGMRSGKQFKRAQDEHVQLVAESNQAYKKALEAWESEDLAEAKHWAILGTIKLRTALVLLQQVDARQRLTGAEKELQKTSRRHADLLVKVRELDEKIELYDKLARARDAAKEREQQLTEAQKKAEAERQLGEAQKKVAEAQLALKRADTVEASRHAQTTYALAQELLTKATLALKVENATEASTSAEMARAKAEAAHAAAQVLYSKERATADRQARNQALQRDAAGIAGITVRLKAIGQTQQLVLPVLDLFRPRQTSPRGDKIGILNAIGGLLKAYPDYPVIINGHTSYRVNTRQRYAVSQSRAQQVANHFVGMGIPLKRFAIAGRGAEDLADRRWSTVNDRVEVIFLFQ